MNNHTYGVLINNEYTDVSNSSLGAKQYATRNGYDEVYKRYDNGYVVNLAYVKVDKKWVEHKMNGKTYSFLKDKGFNPYKFFMYNRLRYEKGDISLTGTFGYLKDSKKGCLLFVDYNKTYMFSPTTGVYTLNECKYNKRVKEHWDGFLGNQ